MTQKREFERTMTVEQMKMEWDLQETEYIQLHLDRQHAIIQQYPKWHTKWSLLNDPVGRGMSEVLTATIQNVRAQRKEMKKTRKVIPLDPFQMQSECTVLSAQLTKLIDKQERSYQKVFLNSICGQGELLNSTNHILNTIEEMGQTHRQHKRKGHSVNKIVHDSPESVHPWSPLIHQTKLMEQEVPACFQQGSNLQTQYVNEEEVLQTTTCSTKDLQEDMEGWKKAFEKELNSFDRHFGDGQETNWRWNASQERTSCSLWKFPTSTTRRRNMRKYSVISDVANVNIIGVLATLGSSVVGCFNGIPTHNCQKSMLFIVVHQTH